MNIFCVGRNYLLHAQELGNAVPKEPMLFMKPTHALTKLNKIDQVIHLPGDQGAVHYEIEIVIQIAKSYTPGVQVDEMIDKFALGIDLTLRDVQDELKDKGHPWLKAKGFLSSALITPLHPYTGEAELLETPFSLQRNDRLVQEGKAAEMIFSLQQIIDYCGTRYGLAEGDLIFTGTPAGVGRLEDGDQLSLYWNGTQQATCSINLNERQERK